jgi:hypothetical protein
VVDSFSHLFLSCQYLFTLRRLECSPLLVTNINKKQLPPFDQRQITAVVVAYISYIYKIHCIWLWNTFKILPRHGCISINQQFNSTMKNNFAGGNCFLFMLVTNKGEHSNLLKVNKYWHDRKRWEKESTTVKGAR